MQRLQYILCGPRPSNQFIKRDNDFMFGRAGLSATSPATHVQHTSGFPLQSLAVRIVESSSLHSSSFGIDLRVAVPPSGVRGSRVGLVVLVLLLFVSFSTIAQSKKQEAYRSYKEKSSSSSVSQMLSDATRLKANNPAAALEKVQEALAISVADGSETNQAKCYLLLGEINEQISAWTLARENYLKAYQLLNNQKVVSAEQLKAIKGLGNSSLQLKMIPEALNYFEEGISKSSGRQKAEFELAKSEAQYQAGDYKEASQTVESLSSDADDEFKTRTENQQTKIDTRLNTSKPSAGSKIFDNSLNTLRSGGNVPAQTNQSLNETKEEIANTYRGRQQYDEEIALRKNAIEYNREIDNLSEVAKDKVEISKTLEAKGEKAEALLELEDAVRIAESLDNPKEKANAFLSLADLYEKNGRSTQALNAYKKYSRSISEFQTRYDSEQATRDSLIRKQKDIEQLSTDVSLGKQEDAVQEAVVFRQQLVIYGLMAIIVVIAVAAYLIYRSAQSRQVANQMLALKSLRSQMNPHFIFNALNSVNHFIAQQDERTANKFLSEFSLLMRLVLENSEQDFISLSQEQEMLALYLKLEHYRFRDKFDFEFNIEPGINSEAVELPPMLIQPYIENAVWHGLRYKEGRGQLSVQIVQISNEIEVKISDNGIGRKKSAEIKTANQRKHNSTGLKNIRERLSIINRVYHANYRVVIDDLPNDAGTVVSIYLPISRDARLPVS